MVHRHLTLRVAPPSCKYLPLSVGTAPPVSPLIGPEGTVSRITALGVLLQLSPPPFWLPLPSCQDDLPFHPVFASKAGVEPYAGSVVVVTCSSRMFHKSFGSPPPNDGCAHLSTFESVAADAQPKCASLPLHSWVAQVPPILGSHPFPASPRLISHPAVSVTPMKRKGTIAEPIVPGRPK